MKTHIDFLLEIYSVKNESPSPKREAKIEHLEDVLASIELSLKHQKSKVLSGHENDFPEALQHFFGTCDIADNEVTLAILRMKLNGIDSKINHGLAAVKYE